MNLTKKLAVVVVALGSVAVAQADLIEKDLMLPGDGLVTLDTDTGLEWLDITATVGRSYDDISSLMDHGEEFYGWRYAYSTELQEMIIHFTGVNTTSLSTVFYWDSRIIEELQSLIGTTYFDSNNNLYGTQGFLEDTNTNGSHMGASFSSRILSDGRYLGESRVEATYSNSNTVWTSYGSFLVRDSINVPEPSTLALFGLGLLGMGLMRRKKV